MTVTVEMKEMSSPMRDHRASAVRHSMAVANTVMMAIITVSMMTTAAMLIKIGFEASRTIHSYADHPDLAPENVGRAARDAFSVIHTGSLVSQGVSGAFQPEVDYRPTTERLNMTEPDDHVRMGAAVAAVHILGMLNGTHGIVTGLQPSTAHVNHILASVDSNTATALAQSAAGMMVAMDPQVVVGFVSSAAQLFSQVASVDPDAVSAALLHGAALNFSDAFATANRALQDVESAQSIMRIIMSADTRHT